jgi:hypothetical protein
VPNLGDPQAWDRYAAMNNNPVVFVDPTGHMAIEGTGGVGGKKYEKRDGSGENNICGGKSCDLGGNSSSTRDHQFLNDLKPPSSNNSNPDQTGNNIKTPPPLGKRLATVIFMSPFFIVTDLVLFDLTMANTAALAADPEPTTKAILLVNELLLVAADVAVPLVAVSYAHWVVTGNWIKSEQDIYDWSLRP